jgi:protein TonB
VGLASVVAVHAAAIYALTSGLAQRVVEVVQPPLLVSIIDEIKPSPPAPPVPTPQPSPRVLKPMPKPRPMRPVVAPPAPAAITAPQPAPDPEAATPAPAPAAPAVHVEPVRVAAVIDAAHSCRPPQYPVMSRHRGETGAVVVTFLIETDGTVAESHVEKSSGFERLDEAARDALSLCHFKPGTVDGRPERSWARIQYVWTLN